MFSRFDYFAPQTLNEAFTALNRNENARILAGGTDVIVNIRSGKIKPVVVVDLKKIKWLSGVAKTDKGIEIGPLTTMNELAESPLLKGPYSLLSYAAKIMGCYEIRNRATVGGNIINASPGAETLTPLTALHASVEVSSNNNKKLIPLHKFVTGPNNTVLARGEIVTKIILPFYPQLTAGYYMRRQRVKGMDLASVNCSILVVNLKNIGECQVRAAFGTVMPTPYRSKKAEEILSGKKITLDLIKQAAAVINSEINPRATSLRATPEYKRFMVEYFLKTGISKIFGVTF
ncbi:MAG: xanthine dehydrogenase family protein subunit M [Elusimicrobiota bacterium]